MIVQDDGKNVVFLKCENGEEINGLEPLYSFSVGPAFDKGPNMVVCSTLSFDNELMNLLKPLINKKWFSEMFQGFKDLDTLTTDLQRVAQDLTDQKRRQMKDESAIADAESITDHTVDLMRDIVAVGWGNIVDIAETMEKISMKVEDHRGRLHMFDVGISSSYPASAPTVIAELPTPVVVDWEQGSNLSTILNAVKKQIDRYAEYFDVMSNIDDTCWVLEPMKPTFTVSKRRIVIDKTCSVLLDINPEQPLDFCQMRFMGPPDKMRELQNTMSRSMHLWRAGGENRSIRDRLEELLEVTLPSPKPRKDGNKRARAGSLDDDENYCTECGICYSFMESEGDQNLAPDQVCPKESCQRVFHYRCLYAWLQNVPSSRSSFGSLFGHCPYCNEWLSVSPRRVD